MNLEKYTYAYQLNDSYIENWVNVLADPVNHKFDEPMPVRTGS